MGGKVGYAFRRHLFLLIGLLTLGLFFLVAGLDRTGHTGAADALAGLMRVAIVPMYLVWLVLTMALVALAGPGGPHGPLAAVIGGVGMIAGLAPYAFADYVLDRWRRAARRNAITRHRGGPRP